MTKRDMFVEILAILTDAGEVEKAEFVEKQIDQLDKRASAPRKPTAEQLANEVLKDEIVEMLGEGAMTATEVAHSLGEGVSVQKASQLLRQLVLAGTVTRTEGKGKAKTLFSV